MILKLSNLLSLAISKMTLLNFILLEKNYFSFFENELNLLK